MGASLHTSVMGTYHLVEIPRRAVHHTLPRVVVLVTSCAVVGAHGVGISVLQFEPVVVGTSWDAPICRRISNSPRRTSRHTFIRSRTKSIGSSVVIETKLCTIWCTFHQRLDCKVTRWTILNASSIAISQIIRLTIEIRSRAVVRRRIDTHSSNCIFVVATGWCCSSCIGAGWAIGYASIADHRVERVVVIWRYFAVALSVHHFLRCWRTC